MSPRVAGALGTLGLPALFVWYRPEDWRVFLAALLAGGLAGLAGGLAYRTAVGRRRKGRDLTGWFLSASATVAAVAALAAWWTGEWYGVRSITGAVLGGAAVGCWLLFVRIWIWGLPDATVDAETPDSPGGESQGARRA